ncbi:MAG: NAD-dependent epimerase/dehydratase family protein [Acidobacteria bacterium]|nr:NAD-dependent epimerase/dehydratase family protein [Acidobacteriota bacterium]
MSAPASVLVTGAGGFVGSALAEGFAALGWRVTALDPDFDAATRERLRGCALVTAALGDTAPPDLPPATLVVHAAAVTTAAADLGWTPAAHVAANVRPLVAMLEYAARTRPAAFVFLSSSGVFAAGDGGDVLTDADVPTGTSPYAAAKRAGELLTVAALDGVLAAHVVRLGYLYGPHEAARPTRARPSAVARWLAAARHGQPLLVPADDPRRDWTFTPDLAPALARLVAHPPAGRVVHLCSPFTRSDSAMAALIAAHVRGAVCATGPAIGPAKAPMRASDLTPLGLRWTSPDVALAQLVATEVAA